MTSTWNSFHVHLHGGPEQMDTVLREHLGPYATRLLRDGFVESWHFDRSWQGGPHLRWRLAGADPDTVRQVRTDLAAKVATLPPPPRELVPEHWYARFGWPDGVDRLGWHPHGTVVESPYATESGPDGGPGAGPDKDPVGALWPGGAAGAAMAGAGMADGEAAEVGMGGVGAAWAGVAAVGAAGRLAAESSGAALAVLRLPGRRRLAACLDLLFATVAAARLGDTDAVALLRGYANGRALGPEAVGTELSTALDAAEADFQDDPDRVRQRRLVVAASVESRETPRTAVALWADAVAAYLDAPRSRTVGPPATVRSVLATQIHLLHNRIGLDAAAECQVAWLASFAYLPGTGPAGFHDGGPDGPDRVHHERAKYVRSRWSAQSPRHGPHPPADAVAAGGDVPPPGDVVRPSAAGDVIRPSAAGDVIRPSAAGDVIRPPSAGDVVRLPAVAAGVLADVSLADALLARRSHRRFAVAPLAADDLSRLLRYAAGDTTPDGGARPRLAHPTAGGRPAASLSVWPRRVDGIVSALYAYRPAGHTLHRLAPGPTDGRLRRIAPQLAARPRLTAPPDVGAGVGADVGIDVDAVPLWLFVTSDLGGLRARFGQRAYRYAAMEAGHLAQNLLLTTTAMGLSALPLGGFFDDDLNQLLLLDGVHATAFYALPIGHPAP
ncbi:lantibiotic dehydratase C-terminal domain-containing protein [Polymorphospora sp. NPDC050346]|uniref:lantibiotic dehydratase C-terminal domain-containing protein n=1 Tax=Polymorphospora sp. NPDC050346 TaxID=3155780 RepID=UPI0033EE048A